MNLLKPFSVLFITHTHTELQGQSLLEAVSDVGPVTVVSVDEALSEVHQQPFDLILIDAGSVEDLPLLISRLRHQAEQARIVVVTVSPTWKRARAALQAGAFDYVKISLDAGNLRHVLGGIIKRLSEQTER